jgi:hypothetical protein
MNKRPLRFQTIGATALISAGALCLGSAPAAAAAATGAKALAVGMSIWGGAGVMIIGALAVLTIAERIATILRRAASSRQMTARLRRPAFTS